MYVIAIKSKMTKPISAPFPVDFARKGIWSFHTRYKIKPTIGRKKLKIAQLTLGASLTAVVNGLI